MYRIERIKKSIEYQIKRGGDDQNFAIFPFGKYGKIAKEILNELGITEKYIVDNYLCETSDTVISVEEFKKIYAEDPSIMILLVVNSELTEVSVDVHQQLEFADLSRVVDVLNPSCYFNPWNRYSDVFITKNAKHHVTECIEREIYYNGISGSVAEAGVFRGETAKRINYLFPDRKIYLFDTFEGFKESEQKIDDERGMYNKKIDFTDTSEELVMSKLPFPKNAIIKKGWFPETAYGVEDKFAFVRLDMDLYTPIYAGLKFFYPRMSKGGFIIVHDCRSVDFDGAREAVLTFCRENKLNYMTMPDRLGTAVIPIAF